MLALIADQRRSGGDSRAADALARALSSTLDLELPAAVTAGDEFELVCPPGALAAAVTRIAEDAADWYVGVGIGTVDPGPEPRVNLAGGTALVTARKALERAKTDAAALVVLAAGAPDDAAAPRALRGVLAALADLVGRRSGDQQATVGLWRAGRTQREIAAELGVTQQAVSRRLRASGAAFEDDLRLAVAHLAAAADGAVR
ncbi:hypothetical protein [Patulibacter sp. SYSU D01012]|uniref:hypothetical protein n=1 Tax=Patulibacter sp. SYSU D01012 TaxID=2817381 RepID=UPI001B3120A8|nr:hypothetical protein [Patulibacter sp. SYSU D01012]